MKDDTNVGMPTFDVDSLGFSETIDESSEATETNTESAETVKETEKEPDTKQEVKEESQETKVEETKEVEPDTEKKAEDIKISNPPKKYEGETEIQHNLRTQIYNAGQAKAQAETEEEKSLLSQHISGLRKELAKVSSQQKVEATQLPETKVTETSDTTNEVSEEEQIKTTLKKLGFLTAEEAEARALEIVNKATKSQEHDSAIQKFYQTRKDIASNPEDRKTLENLVIQKFNITENSSGSDILVAMDMAASYLFPKTDNRSSNAQSAAEKRDLLNFSSTTKGDTKGIDKNDKKAKDALKDIGWTDEEMESFGF